MVKISEIKDQPSLQAWLLDRDEEDTLEFARVIASRAALRVLPEWWDKTSNSIDEREGGLTAVEILRCDLVSSAAHRWPSEEFGAAATNARSSLLGPDIDEATPYSIGVSVTHSSACSWVSPQLTESDSYEFSSFVIHEEWEFIQRDCALLVKEEMPPFFPLWPDGENPHLDLWEGIKSKLTPDWQFWIDWYQAELDGTPQNRELLTEVALIAEQDWQKGADHINRMIAGIEARYLSKNTPLAENIEFDPETQKFHAVPVPAQNPALLSALLSRVEDALDDALADRNNGLTPETHEARVLSRCLMKYADDPQRLEMDFTSIAASLRRGIQEDHWLPDSAVNLALLDTVEEGVRGIRGSHPEIAENRNILAGQALRELPEADKAVIAEAKQVFVAITQGVMAEDFARDIPALLNDAVLPIPSSAPRLPAMDPAVRVFGRASRIAMLIEEMREGIHTIDKSAGRPQHKPLLHHIKAINPFGGCKWAA